MEIMEKTTIEKLRAKKGVVVHAWVDTIRDQKAMIFVVLRDRSGKVQMVVKKDSQPEIAKSFEGLQVNSTVIVKGDVVEAPQVKLGGIEIIPTSVEVTSHAKVSPIDAESSVDLLMDYRWIDLREDKKRAIFEVMTVVASALRDFSVENGFIEVMTPKLTGNSSEGGSEVFEVKYFEQKAYLTQSPQLYKQMAIAAGFEKYFEFTPIFRAENSHTNRHATEAFVFDMEIAWIDSHHEILDLKEKLFPYVQKQVEKKCGILIKKYFGIDFKAQTAPIPRVTLLDSYELLRKERNYEIPRAKKGDLDPEGERLLCEIAKEKWNSDFIFITDYPAAARAFYSQRHTEGKFGELNLSKSFDLLYKGVEITSGAKREHVPAKLRDNLRFKGINPDDLEFYTQFFEYGCPPHGGFSLGLARFVAKMLDLPSIRDATFLFRGPDRLAP